MLLDSEPPPAPPGSSEPGNSGSEPRVSSPDDSGGHPGGQEEEAPPSSTLLTPPIRLEPRGDRPEPIVFRQGAHPPYGIRWYGITSLFGHLRNFTARAIATESVASRDWMRPNPPAELLGASLGVLGVRGGTEPTTLVDAMGRAVWIDFVADTGDDRDVSAAVGAMLASTYDVEDAHGGRGLLPRGDLLVFGGDIAYPVATADEIYKRVVLPWNEQLRKALASSRKRVVLGVPGNHDWYDGLDGFGRLFRRSIDEPFRSDDKDPTSRIGKRMRTRAGRKVGLVARQLHLDEVGTAYSLTLAFLRSVRAFLTGVGIKRRRRLVLRGYVPVQEASYFAMPLAKGLDLFGADRQLGRVDFRQRTYFSHWRRKHADRAVLFVAGDPPMAYGLRNDPGWRMLHACRLSLERDRVLSIAGDFHHYERRSVKQSMHIIAGGGGAFLHGTRIGPYPRESGEPDAAYPNGAASRRLVAQVPVKLAVGRAGWLVHLAFGFLASIELGAARQSTFVLVVTSVLLSASLVLALYFVAHQGTGKKRIATLAAPFGVALGLLPMALRLSVAQLPAMAGDTAVILATAFGGSFIFGIYLMLLAVFGLEHQQAFTVLGHPGFKHFVRLCVHPDGRVEGWTIGKDDMLADGAPLLIDRFEWHANPAATAEPPKTSP